MRLTISTIIAFVFSLIGFTIVFMFALRMLDSSGDPVLDGIQADKIGSSLKITWTTSELCDGLVRYTNGTISSDVKSYEMAKMHGVMIKNISGTVNYNITSCSMKKHCAIKEGVIVV